MSYIDGIIIGALALCLLAVAAGPIIGKLEDLLVYRDTGHGRRTRDFREAARAEGLDFNQAQDVLYINEKMAAFRRIASNAVNRLVEKSGWLDAINDAQGEVIKQIASENPDLLPAFAERIKGLTYGDILYPAEARMVDQLWIGNRSGRPTEDQQAAVRIVRSG